MEQNSNYLQVGKSQKFIFLDTETTGNQTDDRLCQVAFHCPADRLKVDEFFKPPRPITLEAMAITHITDKMVADKPQFLKGGKTYDYLKQAFEVDDAILIAHNVEFDAQMLANEGIVPKYKICTMKVARHHDVDDKIPNYKMQYIRYFLGLEMEASAHNAADDIKVLEAIFYHYNKFYSAAEMMKITNEPFLLRKLTFGKHKGLPFKDVPKDYLIWLRKQDNITGDLLYTINYYMNRSAIKSERSF